MDVVIKPGEGGYGQGRTRRTNAAQPGEIMLLIWFDFRVLASCHKGWREAKVGHLAAFGEIPQPIQIGVSGTTIVENGRTAAQHRSHQIIPHHPAGAGVPEKAVAWLNVIVQHDRFFMLQ